MRLGSQVQLSQDRHFYFNPLEGPENSLSIVWGNHQVCGPGYCISREGYPYFVLEYIVSGLGSFGLSEETWKLRPGMVFGFAPGAEHHYASDPGGSLEKMSLIFRGPVPDHLAGPLERLFDSGRKESSIEKGPSPGHGRAFHITQPAEIAALFRMIIDQGLAKTGASRLIIDHLLQALILKLDECVHHGGGASESEHTYLKCREYLRGHLSKELTVGDIAEACHVDAAYMTRLFKRYGGISPSGYRNELIVEKALMLLSDTDLTVKDIASDLGFSNPYHFSTFFKKHVQVSPSAFRRDECLE